MDVPVSAVESPTSNGSGPVNLIISSAHANLLPRSSSHPKTRTNASYGRTIVRVIPPRWPDAAISLPNPQGQPAQAPQTGYLMRKSEHDRPILAKLRLRRRL